MAYTLKSTGIVTKAKAIVAVDEDGTLKEWKNGWTPGSGLTKHADVTTSGTASFRGAGTKRYFETFSSSGVPRGVAFNTNIDLTARTANRGLCVVAIMAGASFTASNAAAGSYIAHLHRSDSATTSIPEESLFSLTGSYPSVYMSSFSRVTGTAAMPTDGTTAFMVAGQYLDSGTDNGISAGGQTFFCLESNAGSTASFDPASPAGGGYQPGMALALTGVGGAFQPDNHATTPNAALSNAAPGKYLLWAVFDNLLTLAELQSLHDDWFGTLFEAAASPTITLTPDPASVQVGSARTFTATRSAPAGAGGVTYNVSSDNPAVATVPTPQALTEADSDLTFDATGVSVGTANITITNAADSSETDTVALTVTAVTTKRAKFLVHPDFASATGITIEVNEAPTGGALTGAKLGFTTGIAAEATLESGQAVIKVNAADVGASALAAGTSVRAIFKGTTSASSPLGNAVEGGSVATAAGTIIEE